MRHLFSSWDHHCIRKPGDLCSSPGFFLGSKFANSSSVGNLARIAWARKSSQMGEGVLLDDVDVSSGDAAAGIHVVAEVGAGHRLKRLRLTQVGVATGHDSAAVYIAH